MPEAVVGKDKTEKQSTATNMSIGNVTLFFFIVSGNLTLIDITLIDNLMIAVYL